MWPTLSATTLAGMGLSIRSEAMHRMLETLQPLVARHCRHTCTLERCQTMAGPLRYDRLLACFTLCAIQDFTNAETQLSTQLGKDALSFQGSDDAVLQLLLSCPAERSPSVATKAMIPGKRKQTKIALRNQATCPEHFHRIAVCVLLDC